MPGDDARYPDARENDDRADAVRTPDVRELHPSYDWRRDARHLINEAEYEFRKVVGAPRSLEQEPDNAPDHAPDHTPDNAQLRTGSPMPRRQESEPELGENGGTNGR